MIYYNSNKISDWNLGDDNIVKVYKGVQGAPKHDYSQDYLTLVAETDNVTFTLYGGNSSNVFQYSTDSGSTWDVLRIGQTSPSINNGEKILFKASGLSINNEAGIGTIRPSASASVEGNVMSLIYGDNFSGQTAIPSNFQFRKLFSAATNITSAENMVLPATSLRKQCYSQMFQGCTNLSKAPKTIGSSAMSWNSGDYVMSDMFHGCTSLTTVSPNLLPALNLGNQCYWYMFEDCSGLTVSPQLRATVSATQCYQGMFKNCSSLNNVTCLLSSPTTFNEFLYGVAPSGTFYKNPNASWSSGSNGIPSSWTIEDYVQTDIQDDYTEYVGVVCYYKVISSGGTTSQTPCFAVVDDISQYQDTEFVDVYDKATEKWYKLNNLDEYEEYGVYADNITSATTYQGKLSIYNGYEYIYSGSSWTSVGEVSGSTATLPNVPFSVNYNAKNYNASTKTLLKTNGQLVDVDAIITAGTPTVNDGYLTIEDGTRATISGYQTYFNRDNNNPNLTIVSKQKTNGSYGHMFANRESAYNWMWRVYETSYGLHGSSMVMAYGSVIKQPAIESVRVDSSRNIYFNNYTDNTSSSASSFSYGSINNGKFAMFQGYANNTGEYFSGDFYWVYMSQNTLTDEQIQQVIAYNEGGGGQSIYPLYYDEKTAPEDNVSFSSMTEANEYECPWWGESAKIDNTDYLFCESNEWLTKYGTVAVSGYICDGGDKYEKLEITERNIDGSMSGTSEYEKGELIQSGSTDCSCYILSPEYIERTASCNGYVGLGEYFQENTKIEIDFQMTQAKGFAIIGDYFQNDNDDWRVFLNFDSQINNLMNYDFLTTRINKNIGNWSNRFHLEIGNYYIKDLDSGSNVVSGTPKSNFTRPNQMYLFHLDGTTSQPNTDYGKVYSLKIWQGDTLAKDFIPWTDDNDNYGLYDKVSKSVFSSTTQMTGSSSVTSVNTCCRLPEGYTEVEYIENTSTAYIDTGLYLYDDASNTFTFEAKMYSAPTGSTEEYLFSTEQGNASPYVGFICRWYQRELYFGANAGANISLSSTDNQDGTSGFTATTDSTNFTNTTSLTFFCGKQGNSIWRQGRGKLYSSTVIKNGVTIGEFIPCKRDNDNKVGLYNIVNNEFLVSPNNVDFVAGDVVCTS